MILLGSFLKEFDQYPVIYTFLTLQVPNRIYFEVNLVCESYFVYKLPSFMLYMEKSSMPNFVGIHQTNSTSLAHCNLSDLFLVLGLNLFYRNVLYN
jgi:hypothetical protein